MQYVIIGGSAAGMSAANAIRELDGSGSVIILTDENSKPYFRPMLPLVISGKKKAQDLNLSGFGPYTAPDLDIRTNSRVNKVDTVNQTVTIQNGEELPYDRLLIATGGRPSIPPGIEGIGAKGVFSLRFLKDAEEMAQRAKSAAKTVMLGAGLVNLKAALALNEIGVGVTLIEQENEILPRLMEPDAGALIHQALSDAGINLITGSTITRIIADAGEVTGVLLADGRELSCGMVCINTGVQPNVEFLKDSGLTMNGGIVIDNYMRSNVSNVFAAGDVADTNNPITGERVVTGQWTNAVEMGRCAGRNMAEKSAEYPGAFNILNATQVGEVPFVSMGMVHTAGTDYETRVRSDSKSYHKLVFTADGSTLIGALFIGDISHAGLYRYLIREGSPATKIKQEIISHRLHYGHILKNS